MIIIFNKGTLASKCEKKNYSNRGFVNANSENVYLFNYEGKASIPG